MLESESTSEAVLAQADDPDAPQRGQVPET